MIDFLKGTVGKDYFFSAWVGWELELNGRLKSNYNQFWAKGFTIVGTDCDP